MCNRNWHNAVLGVVNRHGQSKSVISSGHGPCLALFVEAMNSRFIDDSDCLTTLTARYEAYISRFADFLWIMTMTTTTTQTDRLITYPLRMGAGVKIVFHQVHVHA